MATYELFIRDWMGGMTVLGDFVKLEYARQENAIGSLTLELPADFDRSLLKIDSVIEIYRTIPGYLTSLEGETGWFIRQVAYNQDENGSKKLIVGAVDYLDLLRRRIVPYESGTTYTDKWDTADNIMKALVRENLGSLATNADRNLSSYLSVQADATLGYVYQLDCSKRSLIDICRELADASRQQLKYLTFDIVWLSPTSMEFRVYYGQRGIDHSADSGEPVIASVDRGTLTAPAIVYDHSSEANFIYCGGQGKEDARVITTSQDDTRIGISPFGRSEAFADARNVDDMAKLQKESDLYLRLMRPKRVFSGKLLESQSMVYGVHFSYGDLITAEFDGYQFDCHIDTIHVTYENGVETLELSAKSEQFIG